MGVTAQVMTKTCSVAGCNTNHKKRVDGKTIILNPGTVFTFPNDNRYAEIRREWVRFCNRKRAFDITNNSGICTKHFEERFVNDGERKTLKWMLNPIPSKYCADIHIPPSVLPTPTSNRKPPTDRSSPDELSSFKEEDDINKFADISTSHCPEGFKLEIHNDNNKAIFYKMETNSLGIPEVTQTIVIDEQLHVKLYKNSFPIPLPKWFA